jgi:hypothetical protein
MKAARAGRPVAQCAIQTDFFKVFLREAFA